MPTTRGARFISTRMLLPLLLLSMLLLPILLAGCGGGGGSPVVPPLPTGVQLTVGADASLQPQSRDTRPPLGTKLDAGATIQVFNFQTGALITTGVIDSTGYGTVTVPPGLSIAVVVTGTAAGQSYRLSTIIPTVPNVDTTSVADPATSVATEALSAKYFGKSSIDNGTFQTVKNAAASVLRAHQFTAAIGGGLIKVGQLGVGLDTSATGNSAIVTSVNQVVPGTIDNTSVMAKNFVQELKDTSLPLESATKQERPSLENLQTSLQHAYQNLHTDVVQQKYNDLSSRLNVLLMPALTKGLQTQFKSISITDLQLGHAYRADPTLFLSEDPASAVSGQITVTHQTTNGVLKLTATQPAANTWQIVQTSSADPSMQYRVTYPTQDALGANPSLTGTISLQDQSITTPVVFTGTASATGPDKNHYTRVQFNGTLTSTELTASGGFTADFPATLPSGARPDQTVYDFPTDASLTSFTATVRVGGGTATLSGSGSLTAGVFVDGNGSPVSRPTSISLTGASLTANSPDGSSVSIKGDTSAQLTYRLMGGSQFSLPSLSTMPTQVQLTNATVAVTSGGTTINASGSVSLTGKVIQQNGSPEDVPTNIALQGNYSDSNTGMTFNGSATGVWVNATDNMTAATAQGSVTVKGTIKTASTQFYNLDAAFNLDGHGTATVQITQFAAGATAFTGSGTGTVTGPNNSTKVINATLDLVDQAGSKLHLITDAQGNVSGNIQIGGQQAATISTDSNTNLLTVNYPDSTHERL